MRYSVYRMREGDPSVYGDFDCRILGESLVVTIDSLDDGDVRALDILGVPIHRGDTAIHISGFGNYKDSEHPAGWVREIGWHRARRRDGMPVKSTIRDPEAMVIVAHFCDPAWDAPHMSLFSPAECYVTLRGLRHVYGSSVFTPRDVCSRIDAAAESRTGRGSPFPMRGDKQHERAVRRLLEECVGNSHHRLHRSGRWSYYFREGGA